MSQRRVVLATNETYHLFNRSVGNEELFFLKRNLNKILELIDFYRFPQSIRYSKFCQLTNEAKKDYEKQSKKQTPLIDIFSFSFMPNHYHLLVKQQKEKGISTFISKIQNSFAKYYNIKNKRHGSLFQNPFKAKHIASDDIFIHLVRYIHLNPVTSFLIKGDQLDKYFWTSHYLYINEKLNSFLNKSWVLERFKTKQSYLKFINNQIDYQKNLHLLKNLILE